ncbi:NlpC/P60 family protein [Neobacillus sp. NPDC097160]|uniref:C40 family peptidase n=1 Tax=Neobacillus sp. NPDC097160 TaxID=3364298 RepID=UPI00381F1617
MKKLIISGLLSCSLLLSGFMGGQKAEAASTADTAADIGLNYIGVPYAWGGTTPSGFDCSGFTSYTYKQAGLTLPRTAADQYTKGTAVSKSNLKKGDLVFFSTYKAGASHVGIYLNDNKFVHASSNGVKVSSLGESYYANTYIGSKRVDNNSYWYYSGGKWYYYENDTKKTGWLKDNGAWYYLSANGEMLTDWLKWANNWYYLQNSGEMKTGWLYKDQNWYYLANGGEMKTGWVLSYGKWYFLKSDGSMAKNTTIEGCVLGNDGAWIE